MQPIKFITDLDILNNKVEKGILEGKDNEDEEKDEDASSETTMY